MLGNCRNSRDLQELPRIRGDRVISTIVHFPLPPAKCGAELCPTALADLKGLLPEPLAIHPKPTPAQDSQTSRALPHPHKPGLPHEPAPTWPASFPGCSRHYTHPLWLQPACQNHPMHIVYTEVAHAQATPSKSRVIAVLSHSYKKKIHKVKQNEKTEENVLNKGTRNKNQIKARME